jgi:hypothetical protein
MRNIIITSILFFVGFSISFQETHSQNQPENCDEARKKYLELNPDVANSGFDPWVHYNRHGKNEGRIWPSCSKEKVETPEFNKLSANYNWNSEKLVKEPNTGKVIKANDTLFDAYTDEPIFPDEKGYYNIYYVDKDCKSKNKFSGDAKSLSNIRAYKLKNTINANNWFDAFHYNKYTDIAIVFKSNINNVKVQFKNYDKNYEQVIGTIINGRLIYIPAGLRKKQLEICFLGDHIESKTIKIKRVLRNYSKPFDPVSYFISENFKNIYVDLDYKDSYMEKKFREIENSQKPTDFVNYNNTFPKSKFKEFAINKKDSLELNKAISLRNEKAIDDYISQHSSSKFLKTAQNIKKEFSDARIAFDKAKNEFTVVSIEEFISKYPNSIHFNDAHVLLIDAAENETYQKNKSDASIFFYENYLTKFAKYITEEVLSEKTNKIWRAIDNQIIQENIDDTNKYNSYSKLWKKYKYLNDIYKDNIGQLENTISYKQKITNELFIQLSKTNSENSQNTFLDKVVSDFPNLYPNWNSDYDVLNIIIQNSQKKDAKISLYNQNYIPNYITNSCNNCPLKNKNTFIYKDVIYDSFKKSNFEEISFYKGFIELINVFQDKTQLVQYKLSNQVLIESNFYNNGKIVRTDYSDLNNNKYSYEFENGINLTLKNLDTKIKEAEIAISSNNYEKSLSILENDCRNNFPKNIPQNQKIENLRSKSLELREKYLKKQKELQLAEEVRIEKERLLKEKERFSNVIPLKDAYDLIDNPSKYFGKVISIIGYPSTYNKYVFHQPEKGTSLPDGYNRNQQFKNTGYYIDDIKTTSYSINWKQIVEINSRSELTINIPNKFFDENLIPEATKNSLYIFYLDVYPMPENRSSPVKGKYNHGGRPNEANFELVDIKRYR